MELVIDITMVVILGLITYLVAQDGPWSAILALFSVIFGGLLAMNFFEPLASFLGKQNAWLEPRADFLCLIGLFSLFVFLCRLGLDHVAPTNLELPDLAYKIGQWAFGLATGYVTIAILMTSLHTAPLPRKFLGFDPQWNAAVSAPKKSFFGVASPDVQWLGFTQHVTEHVFARRYMDRSGQVAYRNFDGLRQQFPGNKEAVYLPTFIIRYSMRRQKNSGEVRAAAPPIVIPPAGKGQPAIGPGL